MRMNSATRRIVPSLYPRRTACSHMEMGFIVVQQRSSRCNVQIRFMVVASLLAFSLFTAAQMPDKPLARPKITGISHLAVYTSNPSATDHFYREIVGAAKLADPENPKGVRYSLSATQFVEVLPLPEGSGINRLDHIAWNTSDAETLPDLGA